MEHLRRSEREAPEPTRLVARLVRRRAAVRLAFEIEVHGGSFDWHLPREVVVVWSDGSDSRGRVLRDDTTRPRPVSAGMTVRVVLELEDEPDDGLEPERLVLLGLGEPLEIPVPFGGGAL